MNHVRRSRTIVFFVIALFSLFFSGCSKKLNDEAAHSSLRKALDQEKPHRCFTYKCKEPFTFASIGPVIIKSENEAEVTYELTCTNQWGKIATKEGKAKFGKNSEGSWILISTKTDTCWDKTYNSKVFQ